MGVLIEGAWRDGELPQETGAGGEFRRADSRFRDRITADGSSAHFASDVEKFLQVVPMSGPLLLFHLSACVRHGSW